MLEVRSLRFDYPNHRALDNVSFTLPAGSVTALVGPNGAGKSTLMRCIAGLSEPLSGSVLLSGAPIIDDPRLAHQSIGYLEDEFGLYDSLTGAQCLQHAAAARGIPSAQIEQRATEVATQLEIAHCLPKAVGTLSRGQRQRIAIGQAIIASPKLLILDEPASGLDPEARASLATLFRQLQASGLTLLVSSHILTELEAYSTHMLVLRSGRLIEFRAVDSNEHMSQKAEVRERTLLVQLQQPWAGWNGLSSSDATDAPETSAPVYRAIEPSDAPLTEASTVEIKAQLDDAGQTQLLKQLIADGATVLSFSEKRLTLAASYEQSMAQASPSVTRSNA